MMLAARFQNTKLTKYLNYCANSSLHIIILVLSKNPYSSVSHTMFHQAPVFPEKIKKKKKIITFQFTIFVDSLGY